MRCHYIYDKIAGKVLIPGCMATAVHGIERCICKNHSESFKSFEKVEYRDKLLKMQSEIKELEKYNAQLNRIIRKLIA